GGLEALEWVEAAGDSARVILLDLRPGDTDALHTLRWLRRVNPEIPVILLSYASNSREVLAGLQLGARGCLTKPIARREFEAVIMQHLEKSTDRTRAESTEEHIDVITDDCSFIW